MSLQSESSASRQLPFGEIGCSLTPGAGGAFTVQCVTPLEEYPASIVAVLEERARLHPDRILFREEAQTGKIDEISYGAFWQIARSVATRLLDCGGSPARPVALIAENSIFYAGAALPTPIWDALRGFARQIKGYDIPIAGSWGSTETGPLATAVYFPNDHAGNIGLPIPGCAVKFVPDSNKLEMRVRAPSVTPGYWRQPELTAAMFDEDGFYKIGDAGCLARPDRLQVGILFDGRIGENFKLLSGTWVNVGMLRVAVVASCPELVADAVIAGHNRDHATALIFPKVDGCRRLAEAGSNADIRAVLSAPQVFETIRAAIASHNRRAGGSSNRIARALVLDEPPSIDGNEITDKGYLNQRAVLERRAALVDRLYAATPSGDVIVID